MYKVYVGVNYNDNTEKSFEWNVTDVDNLKTVIGSFITDEKEATSFVFTIVKTKTEEV